MTDLSPPPTALPMNEDALAFLMRSGHSRTTLGEDPRGAEVLEIATVWGDTVLDVKHCRVGGAPVTVGSRTGHRWRLLGAPVAWVPPAFARLAWLAAPTLSEVREEWREDLYAPADESVPLLTWEDDGEVLILRHRPDWVGFVDHDGVRTAIASLPGTLDADTGLRCVALPPGGRLVLDLGGEMVVFAHRVRPGRRVLVPLADHIDYPFLGVMAFMGFAFAMLSALIAMSPPAQSEVSLELPERISSLVLRTALPEQPPRPEPGQTASSQEEGARAAGAEGRPGKRDARQKEAKGSPTENRQRVRDREVALSAGVLGVFSSDGALSGAFGSSALSADTLGGIGGLTGALGTQIGTVGLGGRGDQLGGGGSTDGIGGPGTRGRGTGDGRYGADGGDIGPRTEGQIDPVGDPILIGGMNRRLVDEVVKRHMSQLRHCYQRVLPQSPDLAGKVVVRFIIAKDGSVSSASIKSSSLGSGAVEDCITRRFIQMTFPQPQGGGIVIVSYPFFFSPG